MLSKDATQLFMALEVAAKFRLHYMMIRKSWTTLAGKQMQPLTIIPSCGKSWARGGAGDTLSRLPSDLTENYRHRNNLFGFTQAF